MGRGILTGVIWGAIVGFGILTLANEIAAPVSVSSLTPPVDSPAPMESAPSEERPAGLPVAEDVPEVSDPEVSDPEASEPEVAEPMDAPVTEPEEASEMGAEMDADSEPTVPNVETTPEVLETPAETEALGEVVTPNPSPVLTPPETQPPAAAEADAKPEVEGVMPEATDPAMTAPDMSAPEMAAPEMTAPEMTGEDTPETTAPEIALQGQSSSGLGQKVGSFTDREDERVSSRLPSIASGAATGDVTAPVVVADDLPALLAYSADYTATPTGPIMSIVLVDIAALGPDDRELTQLPFPVTFAVDAFAVGASDRAMDYRSKGMEVLAMIGLPEGATPQDAATTITQAAELVPVSIGFLDVPSASFQSSRQVAAQVVASAQDTGRGVVTFPRGLNSLEQEAQRAKAPSALILRDFDGEGQDVAAMKRFIEHAALQASTGKTVVLLGRSKPDTIQALAEWSLGNRAASVSIVPLSYLLSRSRL